MTLARSLDSKAEIISADSMQIYRGMDIGTAKPTSADRQAVPHHMIDVADPYHDGFSVENWLEGANNAIGCITARDATAIVVGGTNLYVQSLLSGLFQGPAANDVLRESLRELSLADLRTRLQSLDPDSALRIHPNDQRRMIRAIEVTQATGTPLSVLQSQWSAGPPALPIGWMCVGLLPEAPSNSRSINRRVKTMFDCGFLEEVRALQDGGSIGRQAAEAVGYRELARHLRGEVSLDEAFESIKIRTRKLARQQRTWLRRFRHIDRSEWCEAACGEEIEQEFFGKVLGLAKSTFYENK